MVKKYGWLFCYLMGCFLAVLPACSSPPPPFVSTYTINGYQYGSTYMNTVNTIVNDGKVRKLESELKASGGRVISVGQEYKIIIPADAIFYTNSPRIVWTSYGVLNQVASFLRLFNKEEVEILVMTSSPCYSNYAERDHALGMSRAHAIEDYLWGQDTGAAFMFSRAGIATPQNAISRVEISFRSIMR